MSTSRGRGPGGGLPDLGVDPKIMKKLSPKALKNLEKLKGKKQNLKKLGAGIKDAKAQLALLARNIKTIDAQLKNVGDDAQLLNIDLQQKLQQQQQMLQTMSNISKTLHDTAMAIIRKIG